MRLFTLLISCLLLVSTLSFCQKKTNTFIKKKTATVVTDTAIAKDILWCGRVETPAIFENGSDCWDQYLEKYINKNIAKICGAPGGTYTVTIQFLISKDGKVNTTQAISNYGYGMEDEAMRVINNSPIWIPATQNGRKINGYKRQLITFKVCELPIDQVITDL